MNSILKSITFIDPVTGWLEIKKYYDKESMTIVNLVETERLYRYTPTIEIKYNYG